MRDEAAVTFEPWEDEIFARVLAEEAGLLPKTVFPRTIRFVRAPLPERCVCYQVKRCAFCLAREGKP